MNRFAICLLGILSLSLGCSKSKEADQTPSTPPVVETFPISNSQLVGCHFTIVRPTYTIGTKIEPNVIRCNEGVPKKIQILNPISLPAGLELDSETLSLVGTPRERTQQAPYIVYLENEAGYVRIPLTITVR
jgi:hypothetical protein